MVGREPRMRDSHCRKKAAIRHRESCQELEVELTRELPVAGGVVLLGEDTKGGRRRERCSQTTKLNVVGDVEDVTLQAEVELPINGKGALDATIELIGAYVV